MPSERPGPKRPRWYAPQRGLVAFLENNRGRQPSGVSSILEALVWCAYRRRMGVENHESNERSASTTWAYRKVKIGRPAGGQDTARRSRSFLRLPRSDRTRETTMRVTYRGGTESWWYVKARGEGQAFPGWMALEDVMARVHSER